MPIHSARSGTRRPSSALRIGSRSGLVLGALIAASFLSMACSGGGDAAPPEERLVTLSWAANREAGVNSAGGGYEVKISGQEALLVPYVSGPWAPTTVAIRLWSGSYTATVRAYAALDPQGGSTRTYSAASQSLLVKVP